MSLLYKESSLRTADGVKLHLCSWLPAHDPVAIVVIIHGSGEHSGRYAGMAVHLSGAGFAVVSADLRGHGKSGGPRGHSPSYETLMDDIDLLLDRAGEMFTGKQLFLFGHSLGGNLVLNYALRQKPDIAGVIVTGPLLRSSSPTPGWKLISARILYWLWPSLKFPTGVKLEQKTHDLELLRKIKDDPLGHDLISARLGIDALTAGELALERAGEFSLPLLLMQGGRDTVTSVGACKQFAKGVSGDCEFKIWDGLYHELHNEHERLEVFAFITDWLKAHLHTARGSDII